jgi:MFS transporter, PAT family, beta-lactamase induction signal transducer AmpG
MTGAPVAAPPSDTATPPLGTGWRLYCDRRVLVVLALGFASGLPLLLTYSTLSAWLKSAGVSRTEIGLFALVGTPYALKMLWAPLFDTLSIPILTRRLGRRRSWGLAVQALLMLAILGLGSSHPPHALLPMAVLAIAVAVLSASQDIVIDAYRVESLPPALQGPGAGVVQVGYRVAMLVAGAGTLYIAAAFGWFAGYAAMAALLGVGMAVFLLAPEPPAPAPPPARDGHATAGARLLAWGRVAVVRPLADFTARRGWLAVLVLVVTYKLGEAMAGSMANTLYIELGFSLDEIATVSKLFGFGATVIGSLLGGALVARLGGLRALLLFGVLQSLGNLFYVLQAQSGHDVRVLALCVFAENLTGGMAGSAMIAYLSGLCSLAYTATQYALLSALSAVGRTLFASVSGGLADLLGWSDFFLVATLATAPALLLLLWMMRQTPTAPDTLAPGNDKG